MEEIISTSNKINSIYFLIASKNEAVIGKSLNKK